jgi:glutamate racemase
MMHQRDPTHDMTVVVTDSGLGGISIAAELYAQCQVYQPYDHARIIFFNALFDERGGYQMVDNFDQKVAILNTALDGMLTYTPDLILIACNTLSLLYPYTPFARKALVPVIGIVEIGVDYILQKIGADKEAVVMILATPVTIQDGMHKRLLAHHLPANRIIEQAYPGLAHAIGDGAQAKILRLIEEYTFQAIQKLDTNAQHVYASLQCTHFGYYQQEFEQAFKRHGMKKVEILNPNTAMVNALLPAARRISARPSHVTIEFVSKVRFHEQGMTSLIPFLRAFSEDVVRAFTQYQYNPKLF